MPYLAVRCLPRNAHHLQSLSPRIMLWDAIGIYLIDLGPVLDFWRRTPSGEDAWQELLCRYIQPFQATLATHPWQALISLEQFGGLANNQILSWETLARSYKRRLTWGSFFAPTKALAMHWQKTKSFLGFSPSKFMSEINRCQLACQRLDLLGPYQLEAAAVSAMQRRFGPVIAQIWDWTWGNKEDKTALLFDDIGYFPWLAWQPPSLPTVVEHLEGVVSSWQEICPYLVHSLDRLLTLDSWHGAKDKVVRLRWVLVFYDLHQVEIAIEYRRPHCLASERGHHQSTLMQAEFAFERYQYYQRQQNSCEIGEAIALSSWSLSVEEHLALESSARKLFPEGEEVLQSQVEALENLLTLPLLRYQVEPNFLPEKSFSLLKQMAAGTPPLSQWVVAAKCRPLFILPQARRIESPGLGSQFLERTYAPWWQAHAGVFERDYFVYQQKWIYRDQRGDWFEQGIFL